MKIQYLVSACLVPLVVFGAGSGTVFQETNGVVSMKASNATYINAWKPVEGPSGQAMEAEKTGSWNGGVLRFDIEFSEPADYVVWVLGRKAPNAEQGQLGGNDVKVWLDRNLSKSVNPSSKDRVSKQVQTLRDGKGTVLSLIRKPESQLSLGVEDGYAWSSEPKDGYEPAVWRIEKPGRHHIEFVTGEEWGFVIDKVVLFSNPGMMPEGLGPDETKPGSVPATEQEQNF